MKSRLETYTDVAPSRAQLFSRSDTLTKRRVRIVVAFALSALVFVPRVLDLDRSINVDGATHWMVRSVTFYSAVSKGDFAGTIMSSHPGVTVMIMSGASIVVGSIVKFGTPSPWGNFTSLMFCAKLPLALASGAGILLIGWLIGRRLGYALFAALTTFFLAVDPIFLRHSRSLHLDATNATLTVLSLLTFAFYYCRGSRPHLYLSAVFFGLALLTRTTALAMVPFVGVWMMIPVLHRQKPVRKQSIDFAAWSAIALAVFIIVWPAMWVAPVRSVQQLVGSVGAAYNDSPPDTGVGAVEQPADDAATDKGIKFRSKLLIDFVTYRFPSTLVLGCIGISVLAYRRWSQQSDDLETVLTILFSFAVFLLFGLCFFQKPVTNQTGYRFALISFVIFQVMAAYGSYVCIFSTWRANATYGRSAAIVLLALVCLWPAYRTFSLHPYYQVFHNDFVSVPFVGYGEGLELVANHLNTNQDAEQLVVASDLASSLSYYFHGQTVWAEHAATQDVDYVVVYNPSVFPRRAKGYLLENYYNDQSCKPEYVAVLNGVEFAWLYRAKKSP